MRIPQRAFALLEYKKPAARAVWRAPLNVRLICEVHSRIAVAGSNTISLGSSRFSAAPISAEATVIVANIGGNGAPHAFQVPHSVPNQPGQYSAARERSQKKAIALLTRTDCGASGVIGSMRIPEKSPANPR